MLYALAATLHVSDSCFAIAAYAGGNNFLYDNYNAEMITKHSAQMYCQTGATSFPVVEATIQGAHNVSHAAVALRHRYVRKGYGRL